MNLRVEAVAFQGRGPYSFEVAGGTCCGLTGPSGSGKSLLLRSLADIDPHEGEVALGATRCREVTGPQWRTKVGLLPAECLWWFDRVGEHFPDEEKVELQLLQELGFDRDVLDWQVRHLSTGEKQRLGIARLLQNRPGALLLDEPTASLDRANVERVEKLLVDYCREKGAPVLWVSHDREQLERVGAGILTMDKDGRLGGDLKRGVT